MKKKMMKKWLAVFCALIILPWSLSLNFVSQKVQAAQVTAPEALTQWTPADAGLSYGVSVPSLTVGTASSEAGSLNGTAFKTKLTFPSTVANGENVNVYVGGTRTTRPFLLQALNGYVRFLVYDNGALKKNITLNAGDFGLSTFFGKEFDFAITTEFVNYTAGDAKADVNVGLYINGVLYGGDYIKLEDYTIATGCFTKQMETMWACAGGGPIFNAPEGAEVEKDPTSPEELQTWTPADANVAYGTALPSLTGGTVSGEAGSLNGTAFKTQVKFPTASEMGATHNINLNIGGIATAKTYVLQALADSDMLRFIIYKSGKATTIVNLSPGDFGLEGTSLLGQKLDFIVTTEFVGYKAGDTEADVNIGLYINNTLYKDAYIQLKDWPITGFVQRMQVEHNSVAGGPILSEYGKEVEPEQVTPPEALTMWTPEDANVAYDRVLPHNSGGTASKEDGSLNGTAFKTKITFPDTLESGESINFWIGGVQGKTYVIQAEGGKDSLTFMHYPTRTTSKVTLNPSDFGLVTLLGEVLELAITTEFVDYQEGDLTTDVNVGLYINGKLYGGKYIKLKDQASAEFRKQIQIKTNPTSVGGPILNPPEGTEPKNYRDDKDDKVIQYKNQLTLLDFGITRDFIVEGKSVVKQAGKADLDSVMIDGTYNLTGTSCFDIGGTWAGLQFKRVGKTDTMCYEYVDRFGKGVIFSKEITAADTGCKLFESDVRIQVGFTFANVNEKAGTADVTVDVNIGDSYRDVFTVKGVLTSNLRRNLFLYARDEGSTLTLCKPYMEPLDFGEFGFTKNYLKELRLIDKIKILGIVLK